MLSSSVRLRQVLLTRFNWHPEFPGNDQVALSEPWLAHRETLFRELCFASVAAQTLSDFDWILLVHPQTPPRLIERLASWPAPCRYLVWSDRSLSEVRSRLSQNTDVVLTTRLDSDDALHRQAMSQIRRFYYARPLNWVIANFENGLQLDLQTGHLVSMRFVSPPFSTMMHVLPGDPLGMGGDHSELPIHHVYATIETGFPMFVQGIHAQNQRNRRGGGMAVVAPDLLRTEFGISASRRIGLGASETMG